MIKSFKDNRWFSKRSSAKRDTSSLPPRVSNLHEAAGNLISKHCSTKQESLDHNGHYSRVKKRQTDLYSEDHIY